MATNLSLVNSDYLINWVYYCVNQSMAFTLTLQLSFPWGENFGWTIKISFAHSGSYPSRIFVLCLILFWFVLLLQPLFERNSPPDPIPPHPIVLLEYRVGFLFIPDGGREAVSYRWVGIRFDGNRDQSVSTNVLVALSLLCH